MEPEVTATARAQLEDDWVKASEARYDSMKHLLQSVKHDIDVLTSRIDQTQSPSEAPQVNGSKVVNTINQSTPGDPLNGSYTSRTCRPDILANVISDADDVLNDVYMDIRIRETQTLFSPQEQLLECAFSGQPVESSDHAENKSWRSPSDFNVHDPFDSIELTGEFTRSTTSYDPKHHCHHPVKETDLDDLGSDKVYPDDDSAESLSPAVSPTFENYATEVVNLNNMLVTKDEAGHFQFDPTDSSMKPSNPEEYRVYDNGHALTTIDEASEEIEDDWSSSDLDASTHSNQASVQAKLVTSSNVIPTSTELPLALSIDSGFKTCSASMQGPINLGSDKDDQTLCATQHRIKASSLKNTADMEKTLVSEWNFSPVVDSNKRDEHVVLLRPKRTDSTDSPIKQRPISAGSLRGFMRNNDGSVPGSVHSVISTFSQESVISEADSYVTVASRFNTTGSDDIYTTACSDSEVPEQRTPNVQQEYDDCPTLSRKRTKLTKSQRHRPLDWQPRSESSSDDDENDDVLRIREAIVVTPKFSRLPSKLHSPREDYPSADEDAVFFSQEAKSPVADNTSKSGRVPGVISYKRIALQRPQRSSLGHKNGHSDESGNKSAGSDGSSSADEADYDASSSAAWASREIGSEGGTLLPNFVYKHAFRSECMSTSIKNSSLNATESSAGCEVERNQRNYRNPTISPSTDIQSSTINKHRIDLESPDVSGIVVVPTFTLSSQRTPLTSTPLEAATHATLAPRQIMESQTNVTRASTNIGDSRLADSNKPVEMHYTDSDFNKNQRKQHELHKTDDNEATSSFVSHEAVAATQDPKGACTTDALVNTSHPAGEEVTNNREKRPEYTSPVGLVENHLELPEEMPGARINYHTSPSYLKDQRYETSHIYNDRVRELAKQNVGNYQPSDISTPLSSAQSGKGNRTALPLGAVLSSAEALAARPSVYSPLPTTPPSDFVNKQRAKDTSDVVIQGFQPHPETSGRCPYTKQQGETLTEYVPTQPRQLVKGSENGGGSRQFEATKVDLLCSPIDRVNTHTTNFDSQSTYSRERLAYHNLPTQSPQGTKSLPYASDTTHQPLQCLQPDSIIETSQREQSTHQGSWSYIDNLHMQHQSENVTAVDAGSKHPVTWEQRQMPTVADDIRAASQRTSRIVCGTAEFLDTPIKPVFESRVVQPINGDNSRTELESDSLATRVTTGSTGIEVSDRSRPYSRYSGEGSRRIDLSTFDNLTSIANGEPKHSRIELMQSPKVVSPMQPEVVSLVTSPHQRNSSPSPPFSGAKLTGFRSSPPLMRPRWQLKPIPTDTEIRERLRSRSRQRTEARQSRPVNLEIAGSYRPRSSRSDSRYRCTDLDSAIAESKTELTQTTPSKTQKNELFSDSKQSASLFDLGEPLQKSTRTSAYIRQNGSILQSSGAEDLTTRKFFGDAKSYSSLLETDIDTGENFERPIVLETDVDNLDTLISGRNFIAPTEDYRTRSLFNLAHVHTPGLHRRQTTTDKSPALIDDHGNLQSDAGENWQRTKSLQGLTNRDQESPISGTRQDTRAYSHQTKLGSIGAKGLIERLRERARSTHELRIAQSLTKLRIPEWLDKAECLSRSVIEGSDLADRDKPSQKHITSGFARISSTKEYELERSRPQLASLRSLSSVRKVEGPFSPKWLPKSTTIETVAEPTRPRTGVSQQPRFIRPSQELRERGESLSRIRPINSKLYSSMRSLAGAQCSTDKPPADVRPMVAPRPHKAMLLGQGTEMKLTPQDFVPKDEQLWAYNRRQLRANTEPLQSEAPVTLATYHNIDDTSRFGPATTSNILDARAINNGEHTDTVRLQEDIKPADYDSGTEHSGDLSDVGAKKHPKPIAKQIEPAHALNGTQSQHIQSSRMEVHDHRARKKSPDNFAYSNFELDSGPENLSPREESCSDWHSIDAEGEPESEATDGLDQISDLTCLTSLVDTSATRHQALLANRPSALEHLLTNLGWWPTIPQTEHRYLPPTAAEAISIAAHEFDVDEDSHRTEFIQLLTSPESRRPINLGEFALNHLSGAVQRKQEDGLLYISCGRSECTKSPIQVNQAVDWCACPNCYTLYCSATCRAIDRRAAHDHPTICSFARAKRVCNRLLRSLSASQVSGLTALAKTGMARLGRGGILLPFALVQHAELFLRLARSYSFAAHDPVDNSLEYASSCWENKHLPSPGGLMSPPLYLTLNELEELDSTVAKPCQSYNPSTSMVLIVVVCAYELIARSDGRPVHLFKQSLIIPFPVHNSPCVSNSYTSSPVNKPLKLPRTLPNKPVLPQTNGLLSKPDRQAAAAREAYMIRLQRVLRERGVSLRHHHPEIYTQLANFVETGVPFAPIRIVFHDFVLREEVLCTIQPMCDPILQPTRQMQSRQRPPNEMYEEVALETQGNGTTTGSMPASSQRQATRPIPETDF